MTSREVKILMALEVLGRITIVGAGVVFLGWLYWRFWQ